jgi:hypothetical protein
VPVNDHARLTVEAVRARRWECVRLRPQEKKPDGARWQITSNADTVAAWFERGDNVGLVCHERTGVAVIDPDDVVAWTEMTSRDELGPPCRPWVVTGSGRLHFYIAWVPGLPAKLTWRDQIIGEIQRGPGWQQVVLPGSIHPDTSLPYRWLIEPMAALVEPIDPVADPLPRLRGLWPAFLGVDSHVD